LVGKNHLNNHVRALVINSGNANAGTGVAGRIFNNEFFIANLILPPQ
jgi:glutamate N-acetyltransferase/amino-acid N-acetyltransferase